MAGKPVNGPLPVWSTDTAFRVLKRGVRHMGCCVPDNTPHSHDALRSEITAAIHFIKLKLRAYRDAHRIIPACCAHPNPYQPQGCKH